MKTKITKAVSSYLVVLGLIGLTAGIVYAAFSDKGKVLGSQFSVGSADLKMYLNLSGGTEMPNLTDELPGPNFSGITPSWNEDYLIKFYNNGTSEVQLASNAEYLTVNDPDDLRSIIFVEPIEWLDNNLNGGLDPGEEGQSYGKKTIIKWKTEGYNLGNIPSGTARGFVLRFSTDSVSDTKQGKAAVFDFIFDSVQITQN
jgi:hypothetical protein